MKSNFCSRELQEEKKNVTTILEAIKNNSNQRNTLKCPFPLKQAIKYFRGKAGGKQTVAHKKSLYIQAIQT